MFTLFDGAVTRSSPSPIKNYLDTPSDGGVVNFWQDHPRFLLALAHANPDIYSSLTALNKRLTSREAALSAEEKRLIGTVFNYWHRYHFSPTPFGLFAQVSHCSFNEDGEEAAAPAPKMRTRIDSTVLTDLSTFIAGQNDSIGYFKLYTNNTVYESGEELRYTEKFESPGLGIVNFELSAVGNSEALRNILEFTAGGKYLREIIAEFNSLVADPEELVQFVRQLHDNQLLLFEHEMILVGAPPFPHLLKAVKRAGETQSAFPKISTLYRNLVRLDQKINSLGKHDPTTLSPEKLASSVQKIGAALQEVTGKDYPAKTLLSIDTLTKDDHSINLRKSDAKDLAFVIGKIASITNYPYTLTALSTFKTKFIERYGNRTVPLAQALDTQRGISYGTFNLSNPNAVVNDETPLASTQQNHAGRVEIVDRFRFLLYRLIGRANANGRQTLALTKADFAELVPTEASNHFNDSIQAIVSKYHLDGNDAFLLESFGNSSAGNLIARFAYGSKKIEDLLQAVFDYEADNYEHALVAEVVHVSEPRLGNITQKSISREYEIPILTRSTKPLDKQIRLRDLYVKVVGSEVVLFSAKHGKRVIPKLTNAHNYNRNTIPAYQFLGDMAYHNNVPTIDNLLGRIATVFDFVPRIHYNNVLLSRKTWFIPADTITTLHRQYRKQGTAAIDAFLEERKMPKVLEYVSAGQNLVVDFKNTFLVQQLFERKITGPRLEFREIITEQGLSKTATTYSREYVFALKNDEAKAHDAYHAFNEKVITSTIDGKVMPGAKAAYCKLYCSRKAYPLFLREFKTVSSLVARTQPGAVCFFLPFDDGEFHIRVRILDTAPLDPAIRKALQQFIRVFSNEVNVHKITYDTYDRELERYDFDGIHLAEQLFTIDSFLHLSLANILSAFPGTASQYLPLLATLTIDGILDGLGLSFDDKYKIIERVKDGYFAEFGLTGRTVPLYIDVMNKERIFRTLIDKPDHEPESVYAELCARCQPIIAENTRKLKQLSEQYRDQHGGLSFSFISGIVHMHMIRLFDSAPRLNELFVYYFLFAKLKKQFYQHKRAMVA